MCSKQKLIRITTVPVSLDKLLEGQLKYLNQFYKLVAVSGEGELLREVEAREGVIVNPISMQRSISPIKDLISLWKLYLYFKKEQPTMVHSITPKAGLLSMMAAYFSGVPIRIHTFTGLIFPTKKGMFKKLLIAMDKVLCFFATNVYPEGEGVKKELISYKITSKPLKVLANGNINGIDTRYFNPNNFTVNNNSNLRKELNIHKNDFVFIFVGRLVGDKGINELVSAFKKLQTKFPSREGLAEHDHKTTLPQDITTTKQHDCKTARPQDSTTTKQQDSKTARPQDRTTTKQHDYKTARSQDSKTARLILVGPLETDLDPLEKETLEEIAHNPSIISVGYQEDVRPYFAISNALVFPSYREGFPNVVMQAGAMGLPSIVTNINGCNEIIEHQKNGVIIPVKDSEALHLAMEKMVEDTNRRNYLAKNARPMITSRFEQQEVWEAILAEYKILEKKE